MSTNRPFITLDRVTLRSGNARLFAGTTWRIHAGEHWAVVGPNGGGKSTLLGAFDGRVPVVGGEIWYHFACTDPGESYPDDGSVPEEGIACVSQEDQAILARAGATYHQARWNASDMEAAPHLATILRERTGASPAAIRRSAGRVGILHRLKHPLPALSNGELRRALLACALLRAPRLLVLDDPFAGLDTEARNQLRGLIESVMAEGIQIVLVARRPEELPEGITHVLLVSGGRIRAQGPLSAMRGHPALRSFFSAPVSTARRTTRRTAAPVSERDEVIALKNVTVRYGSTTALCGVSWSVRLGERWALLGPNGSGKSTLLSLITGDNLQAYANDVWIFGKRRGQGESIWDIRRRIGWLSPELQWHCPGDDPVAAVIASGLFDTIGLHRRLNARHRSLVRSWLEHFRLPSDAPFAALGAGEQRMALLARALIKSPDLLLLDEPCQGLDARHRRLFHGALSRTLRGHPCALIYVTHHREDLPAAVNRVYRLAGGRGTSEEELVTEPET